MRKFTYPAVLFYDEEEKCYIIAMFDLGLVTSGETVEEAHNSARSMLDSYLECAFAFEMEIPEPSSFDVVVATHPKELCVLVESTLNDKNKAV
jgi:predicted RNase H-like HicB family nuclease